MYHNELYRLDVSERIQFIVCVRLYKCLHGISPINDEQSLRSTDRGKRDVTHPRRQRMGEELSRSLVHQHGTHCPTTLKTAAYSCHV